MRSRTERAVLAIAAIVLVAAAATAWWTHARWLPHAGRWWENAWKTVTRPGPGSLPPDKQAPRAAAGQGAASAPTPALPRKCVQDGRTIYTDQPCPSGSRELPLEGGAFTALPR